ncbi:uncharacterized protein LOC101750718 isoform X2 [Gallus gallus]|uniref:uncharacterized protein LOC107055447 isoform X2 n=1 Tax=Gallus gallus TaxID=9031 RepID=UPI001AE83458|nr:uncharacterized protein LOC107055447 isoform X2 [Gallus gallus]XP_040510309.1 uncharacterized protein LOC101750718 isoform X2 [Gallus gallus]
MGCITVSHPHIKVGAVRRDLQKMLGEAQWTMACPRVPALLLLVVVGTLQAPVLVLNASSAQEGEVVLARCVFQKQFPATRIVLCKDGLEVYSVKVQEGRVMSSMLLNITERSAGTYTCFYQQRNTKNRLRSSPLSPPLDLQVTGLVPRSTEETAHAGERLPFGPVDPVPYCCPHPFPVSPYHHYIPITPHCLHHPALTPSHSRVPILFISPHHSALSPDSYTPLDPIVIAVAPVAVTLLLSAASCWIIKKGACGKRCCSAEGSPADHDSYCKFQSLAPFLSRH